MSDPQAKVYCWKDFISLQVQFSCLTFCPLNWEDGLALICKCQMSDCYFEPYIWIRTISLEIPVQMQLITHHSSNIQHIQMLEPAPTIIPPKQHCLVVIHHGQGEAITGRGPFSTHCRRGPLPCEKISKHTLTSHHNMWKASVQVFGKGFCYMARYSIVYQCDKISHKI